MNMNKIIIIDGNSLLFRAYYATAYGDSANIMRTKDGIPTNALFAFANMINRLLNNLKEGDYIFVGFDTGVKTFRHQENANYKANRKPAPKELIEQMPLARQLLQALNIFTFEKEGYEGDDVCGSVAKMAVENGVDAIIYTSDRDFLQLVDSHITVDLLKVGLSNISIMDIAAIKEKYGIEPKQIIDYKGLVGDSSDNLPGIPTIGDKTAAKLINQYGSLENIIDNAQNIGGKLGENIAKYAEQGKMSKHLAIIKTDVALPFSLDDTRYQGYDFTFINEFANRYELKQFLSRLSTKLKKKDQDLQDLHYETLVSLDGIDIGNKLGIALDMEETNYHSALIYGMAISTNGKNYYLSFEDFIKDETSRKILEDEKRLKYGYDLKASKVALAKHGINLKGIHFDIMLAAYLLDSSLKNNVESIFHFFGIDIPNANDDQLNLFQENKPERTSFIANHALAFEGKVLAELDKQASLTLFQEIEIPLIDVLADMEIEGFPLDKEKLNELGDTFRHEMNVAKQKVYALAGEEFNLDSPKQIADILFNKLGLKTSKKNSTSVEVLKELIDEHPIIGEILTYRKYAKLCSTYVDGLISHLYPDGKIHCIFNQALTSTGRLSSSDPNLQNISIRDEESKQIREAFYYHDDNYAIMSFDYSQIELRILAKLSNSKTLQDVFNHGGDIHELTAQKIFKVEKVTPDVRRQAKTVNFGIIYGISDWGLSEQLGISIKEAKEIIKNFYEAFPEISDYFRNIVDQANKYGYVTTLFGRRRYLREVYDASYQVREFARRAAMNAPIQGTAADLIKISMVETAKLLKEGKYQSKLILQIHDELIFKMHVNEAKELKEKITNIMQSALGDTIKLEVSCGYGKTWYDAK